MAFTLKTCTALRNNDFHEACRLEFFRAAIAVIYESPSTENHDKRIILAKKIINNSISSVVMAMLIMTNATIQAKIESDDLSYLDDIAYVVSTVYNALADSL